MTPPNRLKRRVEEAAPLAPRSYAYWASLVYSTANMDEDSGLVFTCPFNKCQFQAKLKFLVDHCYQLHKLRFLTPEHRRITLSMKKEDDTIVPVTVLYFLREHTPTQASIELFSKNKFKRDGLAANIFHESVIIQDEDPLPEPPPKEMKWSKTDILCLLDTVTLYKEGYHGKDFVVLRFYHMVAVRMRYFHKIIVTADQAKNKMHKLNVKYDKVRKKMATSGEGRVDTFDGYAELHHLQGKAPRHNPAATVSNTSGVRKREASNGNDNGDKEDGSDKKAKKAAEPTPSTSSTTPSRAPTQRQRETVALEKQNGQQVRFNDLFELYLISKGVKVPSTKEKEETDDDDDSD